MAGKTSTSGRRAGSQKGRRDASRSKGTSVPRKRATSPKKASRGRGETSVASPAAKAKPTRPSKRAAQPGRAPHAGQASQSKPKALPINPFVALLGSLKRDVERRLDELFDAELTRARGLGNDTSEMVLACRDLCLRGGKRLRPGLVLAGFRAASSSSDTQQALEVGVALELVQAYFLIHDDWMDRDPVRRGGPSVHAQLGRRFRSEHLGAASAILAGDFAVALAQRLVASLKVPPRAQTEFLNTFANMQVDAILGQQLDLLSRSADPEVTYTLKTASYTVQGPLLLGALLGGARADTLEALREFSTPAGVAFQLRDDLLGVFGTPEETGKPAGNDLTAGKRTPLVLAGFRRAKGKGHRLLKRVHGNPQATPADVARAIEVLEKCGARGVVENRIAELEAEARAVLQAGGMRRAGQELLSGAVTALAARRN
ncbi:MAG: polyprenyl synthetase family protein [Polyangiaceae bacterium]|nr:polyprenyl synthetase family protein [Polyangiaceae bacterium]MCB9605420.1 polyprenyl synthetase family protein [Polyangiaceae bacterium]